MERISPNTVWVLGEFKVEHPMADKTRENLEKDPNRDMSHVPGTYNPGNQAGKGAEEGEERASEKAAGTRPGRTAAPGEKGKQEAG